VTVSLDSVGSIGKWPCTWVALFGFEVIEDLMDGYVLGNDCDDLYFCNPGGKNTLEPNLAATLDQ